MRGKQTMEGVKAGGNVKQQSSIPAEQVMKQIEAAGNVEQLIEIAGNNLAEAAAQLTELIPKLQQYDPTATTEIGRLQSAETAAKNGNSGEMIAALKGTARWVADFATKVGASIVSTIIEKQMGL